MNSAIKSGRGRRERRMALLAALTVLPAFLYHFSLVVLPSLQTFLLSFTNWSGLTTKDFIGIANYRELAGDRNFSGAFVNNLKWMAVFLTSPFCWPAHGLHPLDFSRAALLRTAFFLPYVISSRDRGKIFVVFFNPVFGVNVLLKALAGIPRADGSAPSNALFSVALVDMWHWWGFLLVIFLSALQQIDPMLYESATVEGANEIQRWRTSPSEHQTHHRLHRIGDDGLVVQHLRLRLGHDAGGPGTELLSTMLYKNAYMKYRRANAAANAVVQMLLSFLIFSLFGALRKGWRTDREHQT
jgi:raffinose/stachyose/melibiose transport system permease protein